MLSSPEHKTNLSDKKRCYLSKIYFSTDLFYNKNSKFLIKKSKIADLTCQIMRKFIFVMYSSFYVRFLTCDLRHSPPIWCNGSNKLLHTSSLLASAVFWIQTSDIAAGFLCGLNSLALTFSGCLLHRWIVFCIFQVSRLNSRK